MRTIRAAVLEEPRRLSVETLELVGPDQGEVLIDLRATGVCHTDYHFYSGEQEAPHPLVLGHEGAGIVTKAGDGVTRVDEGDSVVLSLLPSCGECRYCASGRPFLCPPAHDVRFSGTLLNGKRRLARPDGAVNHFYAQSSFATAAVVTAESAIPVGDDVPLTVAAALGCGATTGFGAVFNTAAVEPGAGVAIFGCGGTGMSAVMAASAIGADPIVAIDIDERRLETAEEFGASETINACDGDPAEAIDRSGGVEYAFEFVGQSDEVRQQAIDAVGYGGSAVLSGAVQKETSIDLYSVVGEGKSVLGTVAGSARPLVDLPRYASMIATGDLPLDQLIDSSYELSDVEAALTDLASGTAIKPVLDLS